MRTPGLAAIIMAFAIAACSDTAAPIAAGPAAGPDAPSVQALAHYSPWDFLRNGGHNLGETEKCDTNDHRWGKRGHSFRRWGWHGFDRHRWGSFGHVKHDQDCEAGGATTGTISGTVANDGALAAGYSVFLLSADGLTVVATTSTDANGAYSFPEAAAGTYLVCEDNPFTEPHSFLGETTPQTGAACPAGLYAPIGYALTLAAGATLTGNNFSNMRLD